jgi:hypothetical protein
MKKYLAIFFLVFTVLFIKGPLKVSAEGASSTPIQINARILPLIWYSTLSINDGDSVKIYAGIQNNSGIDFTGIATFYIDDEKISDSPFTSLNDSLKDVSADWTVEPGSHNIQVKIVTSLPADRTLVSYESAQSSINITRKITQEVVKDTVINTVSYVISKIDEVAVPLVNKIEGLKKPVDNDTTENIDVQNADAYNPTQKNNNAVLGISTSSVPNLKTNSIFNKAVDGLAFLVKNWLWTLGVIVLLFLIIKIKGRRKK